jgi:putative glutamine amidotransferase
MSPIKIGITDCSKYANYEKWFLAVKDVEVIELSYQLRNENSVEECNGIVLSGGQDIHPRYYNKIEYLSQLDPKEINEERDVFELKVLELAFKTKKPIFGICRGLQMVNVFMGGTLIPDIPTVANKKEHGKIDGKDQRHPIRVDERSLLYNLIGKSYGTVNSAHHQAVDFLGKDLRITANTGSIIEALEWKHPTGKPCLMLVQWHPERMEDQHNPFAGKLRDEFIRLCSS